MKRMKDVNKILEQMAKENMEAERREKFEKRLNEEIAERIPKIKAKIEEKLQSKYEAELLSLKSKYEAESLSLKSKYEAESLSLKSKFDAETVKSVISLLENPQLPTINTPSKALDTLRITGERRQEVLKALKEQGYTI